MLQVLALEPDVGTSLLTEPVGLFHRRFPDKAFDHVCGIEGGLVKIHHL